MTTNTDEIVSSLRQLEALLVNEEIFKEMNSHPLLKLRDQLKEIDDQSESITFDDQEKLLTNLRSFEINTFYQLIKRYYFQIPSSILTALFDLLRLQININLNVNPTLSDYYFGFSLTYLTSESTITYLTDSNEGNRSNLEEDFLHFFVSIGARALYTKTAFSYSTCTSHKNTPTFFQLTNSTERLLQSFILYLNHSFQSPTSTVILKWLLNLMNIYGYVPYFIKTDYPNTILNWFSTRRDLSTQSWMLMINLLHNLSRHWSGAKTLNKFKAIEILKQWKDDLQIIDTDILVAYYLVYANLLEPKELKKQSIENIQMILNDILEQTIQAFHSSNFTFGPYNICEYLHGLAKLIANDTFLNYIFSHEDIYDLFLEKFLLFNTLYDTSILHTMICSSLYTIFWSISFQSEYNIRLKSNENFLSFVQEKANIQSNDEYVLIIRRAANGILFNLDCIETNIDPIEEVQENSNQIKVMISYAHKDRTFCKKVVENLQGRFHGDIWVDFNKLSPPYDDDWEEIAKAITQCDVILMIVTENYCSSKSCRREVIHADKRNKRMVPIYQGKDYVPEDWFEIRVGSATWVRFGDKKSEEEVFDILVGLINVQKKISVKINETIQHCPQPVQEIIETSLSTSTPVEQWTSEEVQQWLDLPSSVLQLSSGQALLAYHNLLSNPVAQSDEYEQRMRTQGITREQFANFISSLKSIDKLDQSLSNQSIDKLDQSLSNQSIDQWTSKEIQQWFAQNHLTENLFEIFQFTNGSQLLTYAKLLVHSSNRIDDEYQRLRDQLGKDRFHLFDYALFLSALEKLLQQSKINEDSTTCIIL